MASASPATSQQPSESPIRLNILARLFNEGVMGFLALVALATALGPMVFDVRPGIERLLTVVEWILVTAFAAEFIIQGVIAEDRRAWFRSGWRIVDVVTVLGPVVALLPQVSDLTSGSLMLRVLRIGRAVAFGTRAGSVVIRQRRGRSEAMRETMPTVHLVRAEGDLSPTKSDWNSVITWTRERGPAWFHASNMSHGRFSEVARALGVSDREMHQALAADGPAKLRQEGRHTTLVLQLPVAGAGVLEVERDRVFAIVGERGLLTATTGTDDLQALVLSQWAELPNLPFQAKVVCAVLSVVSERNRVVAQRFDDEERRLETIQGGRVFLQDTFRLRREISTTALDLWHFKNAIRALADGKVKLGGVDLKNEKYLDDLVMESESLHETVNRNKEEVQTLIELHINVKSFEMNKFLKVLAVVSFLGLIPSVVGGLLGMNVTGNPWFVTLGQVAFGIAMAMATSLYLFAVKGWLR